MKLLARFTLNNLKISHDSHRFGVSDELEQEVESIWQQYVEKAQKSGREIWNGTVYRLADINLERNLVNLKLSTIQYKHYLAAPHLRNELARLPFKDRINGMYVSAHVITSDGKFLLGQTNPNTIFPHTYDLISGGLNADERTIQSSEDLVRFIHSELEEETGIHTDLIRDTRGLCILETSSTRIGIFFCIRLNRSSLELKQDLTTNFEHSQLLLLTADELINLCNTESGVNPTVRVTFDEVQKLVNQ